MDTKVESIVKKYSQYSSHLIDSVNSLHQTVQWIETFASSYDYDETSKFNGFRSFIKLVDRLFTLLIKKCPSDSWLFKICSNDTREVEELVELAQAVQFVGTFFVRIREQLLKQSADGESVESAASVFCQDVEMNHKLKIEAFNDENHLKKFLGKYANFHYEPMYQLVLRGYMASISAIWMKLSVQSINNFILNHRKFIGKQLVDFQANFDLDRFYKRFDYIDRFVMSKGANVFHFGPFPSHRKKNETFIVPTLWQIREDGRIEKLPKPVERKIRTSIISSSVDENNVSLIFHVHGGAFLFGSPESHEVSTASWAKHLKTIPVISIEYSLAPKSFFPTALQELLDIYLFLTSGDKVVREKLGFHPRNITLAGDSAGANMVLSLTLILNDIRRQFDTPITLPVSILSIYSVNLLQSAISPSRIFTAFDVILPLMLFFEVIGAYAGFKGHCSHNKATGDSAGGAVDKASPGSHWYRCEKCLDVFTSFQDKMQLPYLSPLYYQHFDQLSGITLNSIVGEFDLFLDENIALAKQWKGKVTLDVIPDVGHGFLHLAPVSEKATLGHNLCLRRLEESLKG